MARDLLVGNGSLLVGIDDCYRIADVYYPHVGHENHAGSRFRFGVAADGVFSWVDGDGWERTLKYLRETIVSDVQLVNESLGLRLRCYDAVDADSNVFVRKIVVRNTRAESRRVKLFLHHDFTIYGNAAGGTAMFDPDSRSVIHYKSKRYFLINGCTESAEVMDVASTLSRRAPAGEPAPRSLTPKQQYGISEYACGRSGIDGEEGTWRDAEDGELSMHAIQQGAVDSTVALTLNVEANSSATAFYWICAGRRFREVRQLDEEVKRETPARLITRTASLWYTWVHKRGEDLGDLPEEIADLYRRSLLMVQTHCDRDGGIVAACDSDIEAGHNDHYSYVWPRDAAFVADAADRAGFPEVARRFLTFAAKLISHDGYFLHKYTPDGAVASSWHAWVRDGEKQLPIQEDETALVVWLLARHYERTRDLEFLRSVYQRLVVQPAEFMSAFRDPETRLPLPSFDLWEERQGVFTFTSVAVCAALRAAADLASLFNEQERRAEWTRVSNEIRDAIVRNFWLEEEGRFARGFVLRDGAMELDTTIDSSAFATFHLGVFAAETAMVERTMHAVREKLWVPDTGGVARYENDSYQRAADAPAHVPGNAWVICTLWLAEHAIARASSVAELQSALDLLRWAGSKARPSLVLPEQIHPATGAALSVSPFAWSHAQVVSVVRGYLDALRKMRGESAEISARTQEKIRAANVVDKPESIT